MNVIKQIVEDGEYGSQTIKMIVKDNERGPQGEKGDKGDTATITAGNAYSTPTGSQPAVMNTGTDTNAVFDFYIPKGDKGDKGDQGEPGLVQYTAGPGIRIKNNVISATGGGGGGAGIWGYITGDIAEQTDLQDEFATKQDVLTAGANITISDNVISSSGETYTAGTNITISDQNVISATQQQADWNQSNSSAADYIKNKPNIPTVNNATLTIQQNGTNVATFTANSSTNATANITSPNITMADVDPGEGSALASNNFVAVYGQDPINLDYSINEVVTGVKWIDGTDIYKKTIATGNLPNASGSMTVAHGISNLGRVIRMEGTYVSVNGYTFPINSPAFGANNNATIRTIVNGANIQVNVGSDRSDCEGYVTLYYTKS